MCRSFGHVGRRVACEASVNPVLVVVVPEGLELSAEIGRIPEQGLIEGFSTNGADRSFNERVRQGDIGHRFELLDFEYPQVGLPTVRSEEGVMVRAHSQRRWIAGRCRVEHPAKCATIDMSTVDFESYDTPGVLVQDDEYPMRLKCDRFASEEVDAHKLPFAWPRKVSREGPGPRRCGSGQ